MLCCTPKMDLSIESGISLQSEKNTSFQRDVSFSSGISSECDNPSLTWNLTEKLLNWPQFYDEESESYKWQDTQSLQVGSKVIECHHLTGMNHQNPLLRDIIQQSIKSTFKRILQTCQHKSMVSYTQYQFKIYRAKQLVMFKTFHEIYEPYTTEGEYNVCLKNGFDLSIPDEYGFGAYMYAVDLEDSELCIPDEHLINFF